MKHISIVFSFFVLSACGETIVYRDPPEIPVIDSKVKEPCDPLPLLENKSILELGVKDADGAYLYSKCQDKNTTLLGILNKIIEANDAYKKSKEESDKK